MRGHDQRTILHGFWATSLGTLTSRVLGMLRDVATASLLGLESGGAMDAFALAFRIPNLSRRLLGEGALATSYLPVLTAELERDKANAARLVATVLQTLALVLLILLLVGEALCAMLGWQSTEASSKLLFGLIAALLPYLWFVCLAAQLSATLQALGRFALPAFSAALLNVIWLAGAWWVAPAIASTPVGQVYVLAGCIVAAGALQMIVQLPALSWTGWTWRQLLSGGWLRRNWHSGQDTSASRAAAMQVLRAMGPMALAMSVTQINVLVDSLCAWLLTAPLDAQSVTITWLPGDIVYPLQTGATAALYYAERFYQLPVGLVGVAVATVLYPVLSRHAARKDHARLGADLTLGLRLVSFLALPAGCGLVLLAEPLSQVIFEHGKFNAEDAARTARTIAAYSAAVWAYAAIPVLSRGFYALGDARRPLWISFATLGMNGLLDLALVWPFQEAGLAWATALSSVLQVVLLAWVFHRRHCPLAWHALSRCWIQTLTATTAMAVTLVALGHVWPPAADKMAVAIQLSVSLSLGAGLFLLVAWRLRAGELLMLWPKGSSN